MRTMKLRCNVCDENTEHHQEEHLTSIAMCVKCGWYQKVPEPAPAAASA